MQNLYFFCIWLNYISINLPNLWKTSLIELSISKMKNLLPLAIFFGLLLLPFNELAGQNPAQLEEVVPTDSTIEISYKIPNSTRSDYFEVQIEVSMDGGTRRPIRSITGDVGPRIQGGKSIYRATWRVFQDVQEIGEAEFYVEARKLPPSTISTPSSTRPTIPNNSTSTRINYWFLAGEVIVEPVCGVASFGVRWGYVNKWGVYFSAFPAAPVEHYTVGFVANLFTNDIAGMDLYVGGGTTDIEGFGYQGSVEGGFLFEFGSVTINVGSGVEFGDSYALLTAGLGFRF